MFKGIKYRQRETQPTTVALDLDTYADLNYAAAAALRAKFAGNSAAYKALRAKVTHAIQTQQPDEPSQDLKSMYGEELRGDPRKRRHISEDDRQCEWCSMHGESLVDLRGSFYISLPAYRPLAPGHCLVIPVTHALAATELDENDYRQLKDVLRDIHSAYRTKLGCHSLFVENAIDMEKCAHMVVHCFPLPSDVSDTAPIFFQKEFEEAGYEWASNKKVVDTRGRGIQTAVPKGFPYVHVDFDCEGGFAHVVDSRRHYRSLLALEVARDLLGADPMAFSRRIPKEELKNEVEKLAADDSLELADPYSLADLSISPPSVTFQVVKAVQPPAHIRDPSFSYGDEAVFEVQPLRQPSPSAAVSLYYAGASLNNSQILTPQEVFPLAERQNGLKVGDVHRSSEFGPSQESGAKPCHTAVKPVSLGLLMNSSVVHPPQFLETEVKVKPAPTRSGAIQRFGRLKKLIDGADDRRRGISIPTFDRIGTASGPRKLLTPQNRSIYRSTPKKGKAKGLNISPLEVALNTAYLPSIRTPDPKRTTVKKTGKGASGKRPRLLTPESLLPGYPI